MDICQNWCVGAIFLLLYLVIRWLLKSLQHNIFWYMGEDMNQVVFISYLVSFSFTVLPHEKCIPRCSRCTAFALRFMWFHKSNRSFPFIRLNVLYVVCTLEEYLTATMCSEAKILASMSRSCELHPDPEARAPLQDTMRPVCEKQPANKKNHPNADKLLEFLFNSFIFTGTEP